MIKRQKSYHKYSRTDKQSESDEETEMLIRGKPQRQVPTIDVTVKPEDTLQSIAIRYHCTIEDIKRLNSIHRENEIYALNAVKVPHRPFSGVLAGVHASEGPSQHDPRPSSDVNTIIFNSHIKQGGESDCEEIDEESHLVPHPIAESVTTRWGCNGADGDIPWIALVACIVVVILVIPLVYVLYIAEHPEQFTHHHNGTGQT